jgi:hypothetical protein
MKIEYSQKQFQTNQSPSSLPLPVIPKEKSASAPPLTKEDEASGNNVKLEHNM